MADRKRRGGDMVEEHGGKRQRTKGLCTLTTSTLLEKEEELLGTRIRLFKWDESFFPDEYSDHGIILIQICNSVQKRIGNYDMFLGQQQDQLIGLFSQTNLLPNRGEDMKSVSLSLFEGTNLIMDQTIIDDLAEEISLYLSINFRFAETTLYSCPSTRFVVYVEVDMLTTIEYRLIEADGNDYQNEQFFDHVSVDDLMEANTEEVGGDDDHDEADRVELMNIEADILSYLEDLGPQFIGGDGVISRDYSEGLKKVESAIEIIMSLKDVSEEVDSCSCCLDKLVVEGVPVAKTPCSHLFHRDCLYWWLSTYDSCQLCGSKCFTDI